MRDQDYSLEPGKLILKSPKPGSKVRILVTIIPEENTILEGLYKSGDMYVTQCEAEGFRSITYMPDRPDNMALYERVRIEASAKEYPVLLSNGSLAEEGQLENGRHFAVWSDPFPKPSYLFALVAGNLECLEDSYTTQFNNRHVKLRIYSKAQYVNKLQHAMVSLKKAMQWDEDTFGLEYDLESFNIVAADDFNAGAMENKSLNIFNVAYILADQETATDADFEDVENVVGFMHMHCKGADCQSGCTYALLYHQLILRLFNFSCTLIHLVEGRTRGKLKVSFAVSTFISDSDNFIFFYPSTVFS
jgi:aminopeptidase N